MKFPKVPINTSKYQKFLKVPRSTEWSNDQDISAILESKLDSVPELSSVTHSTTSATSATSTTSSTASQATSTAAESSPAPETSEKAAAATEEAEASPADAEPQVGFTDEQQNQHCTAPEQVHVKTVSEDERYSKYFKMLKMGVPLQVFNFDNVTA